MIGVRVTGWVDFLLIGAKRIQERTPFSVVMGKIDGLLLEKIQSHQGQLNGYSQAWMVVKCLNLWT